MPFPVLSVIVFIPILAGVLILLIPAERKTEVRMAALAAATAALALSVWVYFSYDVTAGGYQFVEKYSWLPALGISYHVGVDGINTLRSLIDSLEERIVMALATNPSAYAPFRGYSIRTTFSNDRLPGTAIPSTNFFDAE